MLKLLTLIVSLGCGAGCRAPAPPVENMGPEPIPEFVREPGPSQPPPGPVGREGAGDQAVARVGGAEIRRSDIGEFAIRYFHEQAGEALTHLIDERIIEAEARAREVSVPAQALENAVTEELARRENRIRVEFGADATLEKYVSERYGTTLAQHRRDIGRLVRIRLLRDRLVRFAQLGEERIELRDAVFDDRAAAARASEAARGGADLGRLAADTGVRSKVALPPAARDEIAPPELADLLFDLDEGDVTAPVAITEEGRTLYHVFKLAKRIPAGGGTWAETCDSVVAGLLERPLETYEYLEWSRRMRERYQVEILR